MVNFHNNKIKPWLLKIWPLVIVWSSVLGVWNLSYCYAADIKFEATVDRKIVSLGQAVQLNLTFHGSQNVSPPAIEGIEGFDIRYRGPSTRMSIVNGQVSSSITYMYNLIPLKTGTFTVGPLSVQVKGKTFTSDSITIEVVSSSRQAQPYSRQAQPQRDVLTQESLKDRIFLVAEPGKKEVYINEEIPVTIKLYVSQIPVRDIQYPELETLDFSIKDFQEPKQYRQTLNGISYEVVEFKTTMSGIKPGIFSFGPVTLKCNLIFQKQSSRRRRGFWGDDSFGSFFGDDIFDNFFGRYETYPLELKSDPLDINVLSFPQEGKPDSFKGAVGNFDLKVEVSPREVNAGDPITVQMRVIGSGNFDTINCPVINNADGFKAYEPHVKQEQNVKIFEQIFIPQSETITSIPEINFSFFDTVNKKYHTITKAPIFIKVHKAEQSQARMIESFDVDDVKPIAQERLGRDIIYIKNSPGKLRRQGKFLHTNPGFWFLQIVILLGFTAIFLNFKHQQRLSQDVGYARSLQAPAKAKKGLSRLKALLSSDEKGEFFDIAFATVRDYFSDRFRLPVGGINFSLLEAKLNEKKVDKNMIDKLRFVFEHCDMVRYAPSAESEDAKRQIYSNIKEVINYIERKKV